MYKKTSGTYLSSDKQHNIAYYVYTPDSNPSAVLQLSHGMCEFLERYENLADWFAERGVVVCGNDHLGHGGSCSNDDDYGYLGEKDGAEHLADDLEGLRLIMRKRYRSLPYIMLGHSMGSFAARAYAVRYPDSLDGLILSGTTGGEKHIGAAIFLAKLVAALRGGRYRSRFLRRLANGRCLGRFKGEKDPTAWLSKDMESRRNYKEDKRCSFIFTAQGYRDLFGLIKDISSDEWIAAYPRQLPTLIISGTDDPVGGYGAGVQSLCDKLQDAEVYELSLKLYQGFRHEILNEPERFTVYQDIYDWIMQVREGVLECRSQGYTPLNLNRDDR